MTETDFGQVAALLAFASALYTVVCAAIGAGLREWPRRPALVRSARRGVVATGALVALTAGALLYALWTHDFNVVYVAEHSNLEESHVYDFTSLWAGQAGSLMLWCLMLSIFGGLVVWQNRGERNRALMPWVIAVLMAYQVFFLGLINFVVESPWTRYPLDRTPPDGKGLMPLLQNPLMTIHPPALYTGYVALGVPFAFAMAALITGRVGDEWITATRRWTLFAWIFLGCGLLLGGNWAYNELGWGGFWGWDPVENVALLPWLTATALLHSILIQQRRGMLKIWNMTLVIATFGLTLFGTFMNRTGIESSVHAFVSSPALGLAFLAVIAATLVGALALLYWRLPALGATNRLDSFLSRESAFLINNLLLVGIAFAVFWGTIFPILSEALRGAAGKVTVGAPFYNKVTGPLFLALLLAMAAGPLLPWRRASAENLRRNLLRPLAAAALVGVVSFALIGRPSAALSFAVCAAVLFTTALEFYRGARAKRRATGQGWPRALLRLVDGNHGRYGGYIVHAGIALVAFGVTGSILLHDDQQRNVRIGQSFAVGAYRVTPLSVRQSVAPNVGPEFTALLRVTRDGRVVTTLPARAVTFQQNSVQVQAQGGEPTTLPIVTVDSNPLRDIYATLTQYDAARGTVGVHVLINPLTWWVWVGGLVVVLGGFFSFSPDARERRVAVAARDAGASVAAR